MGTASEPSKKEPFLYFSLVLTKSEADFLINCDLMKEIGSDSPDTFSIGPSQKINYLKISSSTANFNPQVLEDEQSLSLSFGLSEKFEDDSGKPFAPTTGEKTPSERLPSKNAKNGKCGNTKPEFEFLNQL